MLLRSKMLCMKKSDRCRRPQQKHTSVYAHSLFAGLKSHSENYYWLIYCEKKTLLADRKSTIDKRSEQAWSVWLVKDMVHHYLIL